METMKEVINNVKGKNGNNSHNNKELLFYLIGKIDKIEEKMDNSLGSIHNKIDENFKWYNEQLNLKLDKKNFMTMIGTCITLVVATLVGMFKFLYDLIKS